jgi:hypothetical protein
MILQTGQEPKRAARGLIDQVALGLQVTLIE